LLPGTTTTTTTNIDFKEEKVKYDFFLSYFLRSVVIFETCLFFSGLSNFSKDLFVKQGGKAQQRFNLQLFATNSSP
jgi:hypothetical protein